MTVSDFLFKKDDFGNEFMTFAEVITKTCPRGLHEKHCLIQLKMFSTDTSDVQITYLNFTYLNVQVSLVQVVLLFEYNP